MCFFSDNSIAQLRRKPSAAERKLTAGHGSNFE